MKNNPPQFPQNPFLANSSYNLDENEGSLNEYKLPENDPTSITGAKAIANKLAQENNVLRTELILKQQQINNYQLEKDQLTAEIADVSSQLETAQNELFDLHTELNAIRANQVNVKTEESSVDETDSKESHKIKTKGYTKV